MIDRASDVTFRVGDRAYEILVGDSIMRLRMPESKFPDISAFMQKVKPTGSVSLSRIELIRAIGIASGFGHDEGAGATVDLEMKDGRASVSSSDYKGNAFSESIEASGASGSWSFNGKYMIDLLKASSGADVTIEYHQQRNALAVREDDRYHLIMLVHKQTK